MAKNVIEWIDEDDEGFEVEHEIPAMWEICTRCHGNGTHVNPSIDGNGITQSEWAEWDDDEREGYFRGDYDVACGPCSGSGKVLVPDVARCDPKLLQRYEDYVTGKAQIQAEEAMWRRLESGGDDW